MNQETKEKWRLIGKALKKRHRRFMKRIKRMHPYKKAAIIASIITLAGGLILGAVVGKSMEAKRADKELKKVTKELKAETKKASAEKEEKKTEAKDLPWNLMLVNEKHPMEPSYVPEVAAVTDDYSVDSRIVDATNQMLTAAKQAGMNMHICSAYRTVEKQTQVFNDTMTDNLGGGEDYWTAYNTTKQSVALPGYSEHGIGLALDIVSDSYEGLDEQQAQTAEAQWLAQNCATYGFILRYPPDKSDETGIIYEPWHYRYVGVEDAKKIMESGVTLETYLRENYGVE